MTKAAVRHGDPTTTRGTVLAYTSTIFDEDKQVAIRGDKATCGDCEGSFHIFATGDGMTDEGKPVVLDGDLVLCPCKKNRVIVGPDPGIFIETDDGAARASAAGKAAAGSGTSTDSSVPLVYDEQVRATAPGAAHAGYPYLIETADGLRLPGRVDSSGFLPRISTDDADEYTIYWGDEALARADSLAPIR